MKNFSFLKSAVLVATIIVIPFLSGILLGKVSENFQTKPSYSSTSPAVPVSSTEKPQETITQAGQAESLIEESNHPETAEVQPQVASAITSKPKSITTPTQPKPIPATIPSPELSAQTSCGGDLTQKFICLLNEYRASKGLDKVFLNSQLSSVAYSHSKWMSDTGIFSHTGINGSRLSDRCAVAGVRCLAENLAEGIYSAEKLLSNWKTNASHNKNLLGSYTTAGIGVSGLYTTLLLN